MSGSVSFITLRLASAQRKIRAFLRQLADIGSGEFPYPDGKLALGDIKSYFESSLSDIDSLSSYYRCSNGQCILRPGQLRHSSLHNITRVYPALDKPPERL